MTRVPKIRYYDRTKGANDDYDHQSGSDYDHNSSSAASETGAEAGGGKRDGNEQRVSQSGNTASTTTSTGVGITSPFASSSSSIVAPTTSITEQASLKTESPPPSSGSINYGEAPPEPPQDSKDAIKVSLKFPWKVVVRRCNKTDLVRTLYAFAQQQQQQQQIPQPVINTPMTQGQQPAQLPLPPFELHTAFPSMSLGNKLDMTLADAGLAGCQVIMRWSV